MHSYIRPKFRQLGQRLCANLVQETTMCPTDPRENPATNAERHLLRGQAVLVGERGPGAPLALLTRPRPPTRNQSDKMRKAVEPFQFNGLGCAGSAANGGSMNN